MIQWDRIELIGAAVADTDTRQVAAGCLPHPAAANMPVIANRRSSQMGVTHAALADKRLGHNRYRRHLLLPD
jgi:hypothetical protein